MQSAHGVGLVALSRRGQTILQRLATVRFRLGDVVVLRSTSPTLPETLGELRVLPLAERAINLGLSHRSWMPLAVLASAMALVAFHAVGVAVAFFGAAVVLLLLRTITMHEAYRTVEWNILFLLGALIPLSHAVRDTGGTDLLARSLETAIHGLSPTGTLGRRDGHRHGGDALLPQRPDRAGDGADRRQSRGEARPQSGPVPDGGGARAPAAIS